MVTSLPSRNELFAGDYNLMKKLLSTRRAPTRTRQTSLRQVLSAPRLQPSPTGKDLKEIIKLLIQHNAQVSLLDFKLRTPAHYMFVRKNRRDITDKYDSPAKRSRHPAQQEHAEPCPPLQLTAPTTTNWTTTATHPNPANTALDLINH